MSKKKINKTNLAEDLGESTFMDKVITDIVKKAQTEKERLLFQRCVERIKINEPINFNEELKKMFPRIKAIRDREGEHWYWDDGSDGGLHLISFFENNDFEFSEGTRKAITVFNYR